MEQDISLSINGLSKSDANKIVKSLDKLIELGQVVEPEWHMTNEKGEEVDSQWHRVAKKNRKIFKAMREEKGVS